MWSKPAWLLDSQMKFADDLNSYKLERDSTRSSGECLQDASACQTSVHEWGGANGAQFEGEKEPFHIVSRVSPYGDLCKIWGSISTPSSL